MINRLVSNADHCRSAVTDQSIMQLLSSASSIAQKSDPKLSLKTSRRTFGALLTFHPPVHNGSAQLSYFIYSCTASNPTPSPHNSLTPSCARELASKRALHPIHNVKQPKNKRRLEASILILDFSSFSRGQELVEPNGIEPMTSCLQSRRSPS